MSNALILASAFAVIKNNKDEIILTFINKKKAKIPSLSRIQSI